jgi:hypothetical protein
MMAEVIPLIVLEIIMIIVKQDFEEVFLLLYLTREHVRSFGKASDRPHRNFLLLVIKAFVQPWLKCMPNLVFLEANMPTEADFTVWSRVQDTTC